MGRSAGLTHAITALLAFALVAAIAAPAAARSADRQEASAKFTTTHPDNPTGDTFSLTVHDPADPAGKPPRVTRIVTIAPHGSPTDPSALPHCTASDPELMTLGDAACPPGSLDASGFTEFATGFPGAAGTLTLDLRDFYNGHGLSAVATPRGTVAHFVSHTEFTGEGGEMAVTAFAALPGGPPDGQSVLRHTELTAPVHGNFFKTPPTCPPNGHWTFRIVVSYADGVTQESDSASPCDRPAVSQTPPAGHHRKRRHHRRHHGRHAAPRFAG
jgi:hypothetical protein